MGIFFQKRVLFAVLLISALGMNAQDGQPEPKSSPGFNPVGENDEVQLLYKNDFTLGAMVHTQGWGLNFRRGKHITGYKRGIFELEIVNIRHPKEIKTKNLLFGENSRGYYFGKLNSLLVFRPGFGTQFELFGKQVRRGVEINLVTFAGPSLGLAKPVYLQILYPIPSTPNPNDYVISTEKYDPEIHFADKIYGRAPYFKGFGESKIFPGGFAKLGLNFEYGDLDDNIKSLETGVILDIYPRVVPIMAHTRNSQTYLTFYIHMMFGRRWF
jgi:hypothetical protein